MPGPCYCAYQATKQATPTYIPRQLGSQAHGPRNTSRGHRPVALEHGIHNRRRRSRRRSGAPHLPRSGRVPTAGMDQTRRRPSFRYRGRGLPAGRVRTAHHDETVHEERRPAAYLPQEGARQDPVRDRHDPIPLPTPGTDERPPHPGRHTPPGPARLPRPPSLARPHRGPGPPRRAAPRLRSDPRIHLHRRQNSGDAQQRPAGRAGPSGMAQDLRQPRRPRVHTDRTAVGLLPDPPGGAGLRTGAGTAPPQPDHHQMVEGGTPGHLRRLQPERPRQDRVIGLRSAAHRIRVGPRHLGRAARCRDRGLPHGPLRGALSGGGRPDRRNRRRTGADRRLLEWAARDEAAGEGDAPWPPNYPKMPGEPPRVQPSKMVEENWQ